MMNLGLNHVKCQNEEKKEKSIAVQMKQCEVNHTVLVPPMSF